MALVMPDERPEISGRVIGNERTYLEEVLSHGFSSSYSGTMVRRFERAFAAKMGVAHAVAMCNGTATLHALLAAANLKPGDEVIVPALTMASTSLAVVHAGCVPVWADVDPVTWTISAGSIKERINERTRAIITVALYGLCPDMEAIKEIADEYNLLLVEDCAQAYGARYRGRLAGTIGDAGSFSLQSSKTITAGEGGIVVTDDSDYAEAIREVSCLGYRSGFTKSDVRSPVYERHHRLGWNYRMSDLQAAVALAQLERMDELVAWRQRAAVNMLPLFKDFEIQGGAPPARWFNRPTDMDNACWAVSMLFGHATKTWHDLGRMIAECDGDPPYACWLPNYKEPVFKDIPHHECPVAEYIQPRVMAFPTNYYTDEDINRQVDAVDLAIASL